MTKRQRIARYRKAANGKPLADDGWNVYGVAQSGLTTCTWATPEPLWMPALMALVEFLGDYPALDDSMNRLEQDEVRRLGFGFLAAALETGDVQ